MSQHNESNEPTKEGPLSFFLFGFTFTSVSTVCWGHPSLVSLVPSKRDWSPSPPPPQKIEAKAMAETHRKKHKLSLSGAVHVYQMIEAGEGAVLGIRDIVVQNRIRLLSYFFHIFFS